MIADYTTSSKSEINELLSVYSDTGAQSILSYDNAQHHAPHQPAGRLYESLRNTAAIKAGIKYVHTGRNNTILTERYKDEDWQKDAAASNEFEYKENLLMFYGSFEKTIRKTSIKASLRGEKYLG